MGILEELEKKVLANLDELEADANKLLENIAIARKIIKAPFGYDEALEFDIKEGLKHIEVWGKQVTE